MCSRSQAAQKAIMQQLAMQEKQISFLQLMHSINVGKPQITFAVVVLRSSWQDIDE
jgi:hypothetical protein